MKTMTLQELRDAIAEMKRGEEQDFELLNPPQAGELSALIVRCNQRTDGNIITLVGIPDTNTIRVTCKESNRAYS